MLWKMLIHGLLAAILIGSAAAVYAETKDNGYLSSTAPQGVTAGPVEGSVRPAAAEARKDGERHKHASKPKHTREGHDDDRDHDDEHDD